MSTVLTLTISERLRLARQAAGFVTARAFAQSLQLAQSTYSQYETGKRAFNADVLARLCIALQINAHWLLFGTGESQFSGEESRVSAIDSRMSAVRRQNLASFNNQHSFHTY